MKKLTICMKCKNHMTWAWDWSSLDDLCRAHPLPPRIDLVTGEYTQLYDFEKCERINYGNCADFIQREPEPEKKNWFRRLLEKIK